MSEEREHALLSASSANRWLNCPPSVRLAETLPQTTSEYAEKGRLAHEIVELKTRKAFLEPMGPKKYKAALKALESNPLYELEMASATDAYLDYVSSVVHSYASQPYIAVEKRFSYDHIAPEGFGTCDCIIIGGDTLRIIDYKNGSGVPVSAVQNPQMKLYALGALREYEMLYRIETVVLAIIQPELDSISEWAAPVSELLAWGESIKPIARQAFAGEGEFRPDNNNFNGYCKFCPAKARCRARAEFLSEPYDRLQGMKPPLISNEEVASVLEKANAIKSWLSVVEEYALSECLAGNEIPGWKAVEGRSVRQFANTDAAFDILREAGYDEAVLYKRQPITLTESEKLLGKKRFAELLESQIIKPPGKPTLAPVTDKREGITSKTSAIDDFNDKGENEHAE